MIEMDDLTLLKAIRARLLEYGHTVRTLGGPNGPNCLMGATYNVLGFLHLPQVGPYYYDVSDATLWILDWRLRRLLCIGDSVARFNDTWPSEVMPRLDAAIAEREPATVTA